MEITDVDKVVERTEILQKEMHDFIEMTMKRAKETNRRVDYQALQDVFMLTKLAEIQLKLEKL